MFCDAFRWDCTTLFAGSPEGIRSSNESGVVTLLSAGWAVSSRLEVLSPKRREWKLFFYSELLWWYNLLQRYDGAIHNCWSLWRWTKLFFFFFPLLVHGSSEQWNADSATQLDTLLPANSFKNDLAMSGFRPVLHLLPALCSGGGVQSAALKTCSPLPMQRLREDRDERVAPFYCLWIACQRFPVSYKKKREDNLLPVWTCSW